MLVFDLVLELVGLFGWGLGQSLPLLFDLIPAIFPRIVVFSSSYLEEWGLFFMRSGFLDELVLTLEFFIEFVCVHEFCKIYLAIFLELSFVYALIIC